MNFEIEGRRQQGLLPITSIFLVASGIGIAGITFLVFAAPGAYFSTSTVFLYMGAWASYLVFVAFVLWLVLAKPRLLIDELSLSYRKAPRWNPRISWSEIRRLTVTREIRGFITFPVLIVTLRESGREVVIGLRGVSIAPDELADRLRPVIPAGVELVEG